MSSKAFVLRQIKETLIDKHDYSEENAEKFIQEHSTDKVYDLLVIKRNLRKQNEEEEEEQYQDVTIGSTFLKN